MNDRLYNFIKFLIICILVAAISWIAASRFTFETIQIEKYGREVAAMDYFGNISFYYVEDK